MLGALLGLIGIGAGVKQSFKNQVDDATAKANADKNGEKYYVDHNFITRSSISGKPVRVVYNEYGVADYYDPVTGEVLTRGAQFDKEVEEAKAKAKRRGDNYYFTYKTGYRTLDGDKSLKYFGAYCKTPRYGFMFYSPYWFNSKKMIMENMIIWI